MVVELYFLNFFCLILASILGIWKSGQHVHYENDNTVGKKLTPLLTPFPYFLSLFSEQL